MNFNETYKKQMDNFCDENITASANDILLKAKSAEAPSESKIIEFKPKKKAKKFTAFLVAKKDAENLFRKKNWFM